MVGSPLLGAHRTVADILAEARGQVEPAHQAAIEQLPEQMRHIAGYHIGWWDAHGQPTGGGGKSVRPAFVLATATAVSGDVREAVPEAVAIELAHDFSVLHDDVMDGDTTRRHRPAAWTVFGLSEAILVGDTLQSLACRLLAGRPSITVLTEAILQLCIGQAQDMAFERRAEVGLAECVAMAERKTGALFSAACEMGAVAAGADRGTGQLLGEFGRQVGIAFQLTDDLLGIWGDPSVTGKPAHSDLANRKKSLPVVAALHSKTAASDELARRYRQASSGDPETADQLAALASLVEAAGGRRWAEDEADRRLHTALSCLSQLGLLDDELRTLANTLVHRDH